MRQRFRKVGLTLLLVAMACMPAGVYAGNVGTNDIQDNAITTPKIANDAVTEVKLGTNAVTNTKIADASVTNAKIGANAVSTSNIVDNAITDSKISDGAVTDAKITGPISGSKLGAHGHYGSDIIDGTITASKIADGAITDAKITGPISASKLSDGVFQKKYGNVIVVAKSGGDFTDPVAAMDSITDASEDNPYLIKIMPGVYDIGNSSINLKSHIDIEGSGRFITLIKGAGSRGMIIAADAAASDMEVRKLSLEIDFSGVSGYYFGAVSSNAAFLKVSDVSIMSARQDGGLTTGIYYNLPGNGRLILDNVDITASGELASNYGVSGFLNGSGCIIVGSL